MFHHPFPPLALAAMVPLAALCAAAEEPAAFSFTDAERLATGTWVLRIQPVTLRVCARAMRHPLSHCSEQELINITLASLPMDELPADLRSYVTARRDLICANVEKRAAWQKRRQALKRGGTLLDDAQFQALAEEESRMWEEYRAGMAALEAQYPRAAFICTWLDKVASWAGVDLRNELGKAPAFLAAHPGMNKRARATEIAWLLHLAAEYPPEPAPEAAREAFERLILLNRLDYWANGTISCIDLETGKSDVNLLPDDRHSGYSWKLAAPLPPDSPVQLEWRTLPRARLQEHPGITLAPCGKETTRGEYVYPSPDITTLTIHARKAGEVEINLIYTRPGDVTPLLRHEFLVDVVEK